MQNATSSAKMARHMDDTSLNYFSAVWREGRYPRSDAPDGACGGPGSCCCVLPGKGCLCVTAVSKAAAFNDMPPLAKDALLRLIIEAVDLTVAVSASAGVAYQIKTNIVTGIAVHKKVSAGVGAAAFDVDTVFNVQEERTGRTFFLKNVVSTVNVAARTFSFQNSPTSSALSLPRQTSATPCTRRRPSLTTTSTTPTWRHFLPGCSSSGSMLHQISPQNTCWPLPMPSGPAIMKRTMERAQSP